MLFCLLHWSLLPFLHFLVFFVFCTLFWTLSMLFFLVYYFHIFYLLCGCATVYTTHLQRICVHLWVLFIISWLAHVSYDTTVPIFFSLIPLNILVCSNAHCFWVGGFNCFNRLSFIYFWQFHNVNNVCRSHAPQTSNFLSTQAPSMCASFTSHASLCFSLTPWVLLVLPIGMLTDLVGLFLCRGP